MAANPLVDQGTLNRVRASVVWVDHPELNVTAGYLGRDGIRLGLEGQAAAFLPTMTGAVTSPEPYMMINLTIHLLKTQALAQAYKAQMENIALVGNGTVRPDLSTGIDPYDIVNCAIEGVRELNFSGQDEGFVISCRGYYILNNSLWE